MAFHLTQGTFSYLPPLTDHQIKRQIQYALDNDWPLSVEYTDEPHPRNTYWHMWGLPMFDQKDPAAIFYELEQCKKAFPYHYIRLNAYDRRLGRQTVALSFIVQRPGNDPGFRLVRQESPDRQIHYTIESYASMRPEGERFTE